MARSGIRYEEVQAAAETLLGRGLNPTIQRVRELLGTGSNTTISEHLKHWQQHLAQAPKAILPPTVPEAVATALDDFWKIAVRHAEAAFEEQRAAAAQAVLEAEKSRDIAIAEQRQAQSSALDCQRELESTQTAARELADRLLVEQERRTAAETAIEVADQRAQAAAETIAQIRAETAARVLQLEITLQQQRSDADRQLAEAQRQLEFERQRSEAGEARLLAMLDQIRLEQKTDRKAFATERQDWKNQEIHWREQSETARRENAELRANLTAAAERQNALNAELGQVRPRLQDMEARHLETVREAEGLRGELKAVQEDRNRLRRQLDALSAPSPDPIQVPVSD
ncbi:MAG: DNA-binding protein [Candidatus Contendobacter sp.]|nr:DNA-binding protein [Candidatus Contendobacter sp.]MDG4559527.1 DNA-binding protein [Candidatus Contendobacter sp.]